MNLYYNVTNAALTTCDGNRHVATPTIAYGDAPRVNFAVYSSGSVPADISDAVSWSAAIDVDRNIASAVCCRVEPEQVSVVDNVISFELNTLTEEFFNAVNDRSDVRELFFEIYGFDTAGRRIYRFSFRAGGLMPVDSADALPPTVLPDVNARLDEMIAQSNHIIEGQ